MAPPAKRKKFTTGIPRDLKEELAADADSKRMSGVKDSLKRVTGRKEKRKMKRQAKKMKRVNHGFGGQNGFAQGKKQQQQQHFDDDDDSEPAPPPRKSTAAKKPSPKKISSKRAPSSGSESDSPAPKPKSILKKTKKKAKDPSPSPEPSEPRLSRAVIEKLADDERDIKYYEKKLKIKKGKLPKAFQEDGLDFLLEGLEDMGRFEPTKPVKGKKEEKKKDKEEKVDKKRKREVESESDSEEEESGSGSEDDEEGYTGESEEEDLDAMFLGGGDSDEEMEDGSEEDDNEDDDEDDDEEDDEEDEGEFGDSDGSEDEKEEPAPKRERENPYRPPTAPSTTTSSAAQTTGKYIPPSLRKAASTDDEAMVILKRQIQGQINRLTESNLLAIVGEMEKLYRTNPRANVTSAITSILMAMTCDKSTLLDTFMIIHAGFIAALYKLIGTDFGASITQRIIEEFLKCYEKANKDKPEEEGKECTNLMSLLSELYNFGVVGSVLIFDFVRMFLEDLRELNTELLLKVVRNSGYQLRQDDPTALKDLVTMLQPAIAKVGGQDKLSVRTKFMIETITNLKNNRLKTATANSAVISESTIRMKKILGSLSNRPLRATEPLRVSLDDIKNSTKEGKWWLVGASWRDPAKLKSAEEEKASEASKDEDKKDKKKKKKKLDDSDDDTLGNTTDLLALARQQGMNTDVRRAIFVTLMSSSDFKDAHERLLKLRLKKSQELEIPRVIIHCCGNEQVHNSYYFLLAKRLCAASHPLKMAFQFSLWEVFKRMGEDGGEEIDEDEMPTRKIVNLAKMYGSLVADDALTLGILKTLDLSYLQRKTKTFLEIFFITIFLRLEGEEDKINTLIERIRDKPEQLKGLLYFITHTMVKTDVAGGKAENALCRLSAKTMGKTLKVLVALETVGDS